MSEEARQLLQATYDSSYRAARAALGAAADVPARLSAVRLQLEALDGTLNGFRALSGARLDCRAGCSFCCCSLRIDVRAHEVLLLARHLRETRDAELMSDLVASLRAIAALREGVEPEDRSPIPCPLLFDSRCSVYSHRPSACRRYLSVSVAACEELWREGATAREIETPWLAESGRHASLGLHHALLAEGYDAYSYELTPALAEALTDDACEARWQRREKVFSAAAESLVPDGFSQAEAIANLRAQLAARREPASTGGAVSA